MLDHYMSWSDLHGQETEGQDYTIEWRQSDSRVLIMAPHAGKIELYTDQLAEAVAGKLFSYYAFKGIKAHDNAHLHLTSHRFEEPIALRALAAADYVVTIHGEKTSAEKFIVLGGLDTELGQELKENLSAGGFHFRTKTGLEGLSPLNICNRGRRRKGVQVELSYGLRQALMEAPSLRQRFINIMQGCLVIKD